MMTDIHWRYKSKEHAESILLDPNYNYIVIPEDDKKAVRENILECLANVNDHDLVRKQLSEAISNIVKLDFP